MATVLAVRLAHVWASTEEAGTTNCSGTVEETVVLSRHILLLHCKLMELPIWHCRTHSSSKLFDLVDICEIHVFRKHYGMLVLVHHPKIHLTIIC